MHSTLALQFINVSCWSSFWFFFHLFSFLFIYFSSLVYTLANSGSTYYQHCINMNMQCKLISLPFHKQLNYLFTVSDIIAYSINNSTILANLKYLFINIICYHHHYLCCFTAASTVITLTVNLFSFSAEFSHLILAFKDILNVFHYQIYWFFLIKAKLQ